MGVSDGRRATECEPRSAADLSSQVLTAAAILARAADVVERRGLARGTYHKRQLGSETKHLPVCTLGAIAIAAGAGPSAWEEMHLWKRELASAAVAIESLLRFLGLNSEEKPDETLGRWNDSHSNAAVIRMLRAAAQEAGRAESDREES